MKTSFLLENIEEEQFKVLADAMKKKQFKAGETIVKYGDIGQEYFILSEGTYEVTTYRHGTKADDSKLDEKIADVETLKVDIKASPSLPMVDFGEIVLSYTDEAIKTTVKA